MDSNQRNLNSIEKDVELMEEVCYNLVEKEKGSESEYDEDDDSRMFVLDEPALETAKNLFDSQRSQDAQDEESSDEESDEESGEENDEEFHIFNDSNNEGDFVIPDTKPTKLSPCVIIDNSNSTGTIS